MDPCSKHITDLEYLKHMIPHHQVAVDISVMLQKKTKSPIMHEILRKLIWTQKYEIEMMKQMLTTLYQIKHRDENGKRNINIQ